jgi:hypothetical protein
MSNILRKRIEEFYKIEDPEAVFKFIGENKLYAELLQGFRHISEYFGAEALATLKLVSNEHHNGELQLEIFIEHNLDDANANHALEQLYSSWFLDAEFKAQGKMGVNFIYNDVAAYKALFGKLPN